MILYYIKIAYRNLMRNKVRSLIAVTGLAAGISLFSFCLYLVRYKHDNVKRIYNYERIATFSSASKGGGGRMAFSLPEIKQLQDLQIPQIEAIGAARPWGEATYQYQQPDGRELFFYTYTAYAESSFFRVFSLPLLSGTVEGLFSQPGSVVLTDEFAQKVYPDIDPIGKTIKNNHEVYTIRGIIQKSHLDAVYSSRTVDMVRCVLPEDQLDCYLETYLLLTDKNSFEEVSQRLEKSGCYFEGDEKFFPQIHAINDIKVQSEDWAMILVGLLVLLTGLINYLSFSIGMFYNRAKNLLLQVCLGATAKHLFALIFTELLLFLTLAVFFSYCLCEVGGKLLFESINGAIGADYIRFDLNWFFLHQLQYFVGLIVVVGIVSVIAVWRLMRNPIMRGLRGGSIRKHTLRNIMLGFQFFICFLFLGFIVVMQGQYDKMFGAVFSTFPEKEQQRTFVVSLDYPQFEGEEDRIYNQLKANASVEEAMTTSTLIELGKTELLYADSGKYIEFVIVEASPNFAAFIHLPVIQGVVSLDRQSLTVSKDVALFLDKHKKNGQIEIAKQSYAVSGVTESLRVHPIFKHTNVVIKQSSIIKYCYLKAVAGKEAELEEYIRTTLIQNGFDATEIKLNTFDQTIRAKSQILVIFLKILSAMTLICIIMVLMGVFAAITLDTESKQKEVAIRKINGASFSDVILLFSKLYVWLLAIAFVLATPLIWLLSSFLLSHFVERININNPVIWIGLLLSVLFVVALIVSYKLIWIARLNPARIIKSE